MLPLGLGYVEGVTHDSLHNGTITLFATLAGATGKGLAQCKNHHQEFLSFLQQIARNVANNLDIEPLGKYISGTIHYGQACQLREDQPEDSFLSPTAATVGEGCVKKDLMLSSRPSQAGTNHPSSSS